jgi:hypothetical protein
MMKKLFLTTLFLFLSACNDGGGEPQPKLVDSPAPMPCGKGCTGWRDYGSLDCQQNGSCENQVLNVDKMDWIRFFGIHFKEELPQKEHKGFHCGYKLSQKAEGQLSLLDFSREATQYNFIKLASYMINSDTCTLRGNPEESLYEYFNSSSGMR